MHPAEFTVSAGPTTVSPAVMAAMGYDFMTATSAVLTSLANVGPGIGPIIGPVGNFSTVEIDEHGMLRVTYDTGFTRTIAQIPLVDVPNLNGLIALDSQTYQVSAESGSFYLWDAGDGPTGAVVGYARENSTTDVAHELTDLIQTQRAYSSNAKVIQTVDEMLQETTNIKR